MKKGKLFLASLLSLVLVSTASTTALANETEGWRYLSKSMTYKWAPNFTNTTFKNAWTGAANSWNSQGMDIYQHSNSVNTLGSFYELSTSLYGQMSTYASDLKYVTKFVGELNSGNSNNVNTNVPLSAAVHEIGHSMGLAHNWQHSIMNSNRDRKTLYFPTAYDIQTMKQLYAGSIGWRSQASGTNEEIQNETSQVTLSYDFPTAKTIEEMASEADVIISGEYNSNEYERWNMSRNPENYLEESSERYAEGRLYNFVVDNVLRGNLSEEEIKVNHRALEIMKIEIEEGQPQEVTVDDPRFIEPIAGQKYLLFLKKDDKMNNYYGAIEPFSVLITDQNNVKLESNLLGAKEHVDKFYVSNDVYLQTIEEGTADTISGSSLSELLQKIGVPTQ